MNPTAAPGPSSRHESKQTESAHLHKLIMDLTEVEKKAAALGDLCTLLQNEQDIAPILWNSPCCVALLLQEVICTYDPLLRNSFSDEASNRACSAVAILRFFAGHPETRKDLVKSHIPVYLYPTFCTELVTRPYLNIRLASLGVLGTLVKAGTPEVIELFIETNLMDALLAEVEHGTNTSKTLSIFIIRRSAGFPDALEYICETADRFFVLISTLSILVKKLEEAPDAPLLKEVVRTYLNLAQDSRAKKALQECCPDSLEHILAALLPDSRESVTYWFRELQQALGNVPGTSAKDCQTAE